MNTKMSSDRRAELDSISEFQHAVKTWTHECFGAEVANDKTLRNHRFLEEALELANAHDFSMHDAITFELEKGSIASGSREEWIMTVNHPGAWFRQPCLMCGQPSGIANGPHDTRCMFYETPDDPFRPPGELFPVTCPECHRIMDAALEALNEADRAKLRANGQGAQRDVS